MLVFAIIGIALICYALVYLLLLCVLDCDIQLAFYEKFGKPISSMRGKVVFITGASSGIGQHTAIALAKRGVKLALAARRQNELEQVKRQCLESSNGKLTENDILVIPMDLTKFESHEYCFKLAVQHFGQVDVLFNNAGRSQRAAWENIELAVDKELFDINVFAVIHLTRVAIRYFKTRGHGHIAVNSSAAGIIGVPLSASYTGSKHAIHGYFNSLRVEKTGSDFKLTVSIVCPGPTFSNFLEECFTEKSGMKYGIPQGSNDRRMRTERCGELIGVTLANQLSESWMAIFPLVIFMYIWAYFPTLTAILLKVVGPAKIFKFRDSHDIKLNEDPDKAE